MYKQVEEEIHRWDYIHEHKLLGENKAKQENILPHCDNDYYSRDKNSVLNQM